MSSPIGYKVHVDQTQTQGQWKAKVGHDKSGNKEIIFFRGENKTGLMAKFNDIKKNVMDGEKAAKKYLQGQFQTTRGSEVTMRISQPRAGLKKEDILQEHFDKFKRAGVTNQVKQNSDLPSTDFMSGKDAAGETLTPFTVDFIKS